MTKTDDITIKYICSSKASKKENYVAALQARLNDKLVKKHWY